MTLANNTYFFKTIFFFFAIINKSSQNPHNKALQKSFLQKLAKKRSSLYVRTWSQNNATWKQTKTKW